MLRASFHAFALMLCLLLLPPLVWCVADSSDQVALEACSCSGVSLITVIGYCAHAPAVLSACSRATHCYLKRSSSWSSSDCSCCCTGQHAAHAPSE
jgi:hypothetical protein